MAKTASVDEYIARHEKWREALKALRDLVRQAPLEETIKWGMPVYTYKGKNVVGLGAFKSYVGLWFFQGALLKDTHHRLVNAQEGRTRAMRQWRFDSVEAIRNDADLIRAYIQEAVEHQRAGREIKPDREKPLQIPPELQQALEADTTLRQQFEALTPGRRREYAGYIADAKRAETRQKRLEKIIPMILEGRGLNDRYR